MDATKYILGYYYDEHNLLEAVKKIKEKGLRVNDVISPYPIHGLDDILEFKRTRIPTVGFLVGITCGLLMVSFMSWTFLSSYPLNIGGKPQFSLPAFVPIWFEVSILTCAISMVVTYFYSCRLKPAPKSEFNPIFDKKQTDDTMLIVFKSDNTNDEAFKSALKDTGADDIKEAIPEGVDEYKYYKMEKYVAHDHASDHAHH